MATGGLGVVFFMIFFSMFSKGESTMAFSSVADDFGALTEPTDE